MNAKRAILLFALIVFATSTLFPPWCYVSNPNGHRTFFSAGVHFLLSPPDPAHDGYSYGVGVQVDFGRLALEWVCLAALWGVGTQIGSMTSALKRAWAALERQNAHTKSTIGVAFCILVGSFTVIMLFWISQWWDHRYMLPANQLH